MLVDLNRSCLFILVRNPLDTLNAAYCLVVLRGLVFCVFSAIDSQTTSLDEQLDAIGENKHEKAGIIC